jgi:hypothetical protein
MSTTLNSFNHVLCEFIEELSLTFDEVPQIKLYKAGLPSLLTQDERAGLNFFMNAVRSHGNRIMAKDETLFSEDAIDLGMGLSVSELWHAEGLDDDTRNAIWNYLTSLFILGMTIESLDSDMLGAIENLANETANKLKNQGGGLDISNMLPDLMSSVGGILGAGPIDGSDQQMGEILQSVMSSMNFSGMQNLLPPQEDDMDV